MAFVITAMRTVTCILWNFDPFSCCPETVKELRFEIVGVTQALSYDEAFFLLLKHIKRKPLNSQCSAGEADCEFAACSEVSECRSA